MEIFVLALLCGLATYFWRAMAVLLSGHLSVDSELFRWIECVAYAMVAGLMMRIVLLPSGVLAGSAMMDRILGCLIALAAYRLLKRNLLAGLAAGVGFFVCAAYVRPMLG
jgi:branched-subunit amino acid transport protein